MEGNHADGYGGAVAFLGRDYSSRSRVEYSTFHDNSVRMEGGGIYVEPAPSVGFTVYNVTISANRATDPNSTGGGISGALSGALEVDFSTLVDNEAKLGSQFKAEGINTDIGQTVLSGPVPVCEGLFSGSAQNVATDGSCTGLPHIVASPNLGALMDNGGNCGGAFHPCLTREPGAGSPLIGAAAICVSDDQRHEPRAPTACWIGAYED